jgi:hypothetical protein
MNEGRHAFRLTADIEQARVWELIEARVTLAFECVGCHRRTTWPPELIRSRLHADRGKRLIAVAGKFRCAACRSPFVLISRERKIDRASISTATERVDPAAKRGFVPANLDANARGRPPYQR